jgi:hypothetical protein
MYHLSKTTYVLGLQCIKALYLNRYFPALRATLPAERKLRFDKGHQIGKLARSLFPDGMDLSPSGPRPDRKSLAATQKGLADGQRALFEASFLYDGVVVLTDILVPDHESWKLHEVKSSTVVSDVYREDLALQYYILKKSQIRLIKASILYLAMPYNQVLNRSTGISREDFLEEDLTAYCEEKMSEVAEHIRHFQVVLAGRRIPDIAIGPQCEKPYHCDFLSYCSQKPENREPNEGLFS